MLQAEAGKPRKFCFEICSTPLFLQKIFPHGNAKKKQRIILVAVLYFSCCFDFSHCYALALADAYYAFCIYLLCSGNGYCLDPGFMRL